MASANVVGAASAYTAERTLAAVNLSYRVLLTRMVIRNSVTVDLRL